MNQLTGKQKIAIIALIMILGSTIACLWAFRKQILARLSDLRTGTQAIAQTVSQNLLSQTDKDKKVLTYSQKTSGKRPQKPNKPGKILVAGKAAISVDGCNLALRSVRNGIAEIDVTKPNMAVTRLAKLRTGSMTRFSTADQQYYVRVSEVGKDFVRISVKKGAEI